MEIVYAKWGSGTRTDRVTKRGLASGGRESSEYPVAAARDKHLPSPKMKVVSRFTLLVATLVWGTVMMMVVFFYLAPGVAEQQVLASALVLARSCCV